MSVAAVRSPTEYEDRLRSYLFERAEEGRAVRVGEKEVSEQAAIIARYPDLFTRDQLEALRSAEETAGDDDRERCYRLRKACEAGLAASELSERRDQLENAMLAARVTFRGESMPLRTAQAMLAVLPEYEAREELGALHGDASAAFNEDRLALLTADEELAAELSGISDAVERNEEEKGISLDDLNAVLERASDASAEAFSGLRDRWFERLLGSERPDVPSSYHVSYLRRLSPLESTYTKERATEVCLATLIPLGFDLANDPKINLDIEDRPQKSPRACVISSDAPNVVHLITRAAGGLHDYQAFLHEAGHALHFAGCDPDLPYTFRNLARDHAHTEIFSYIVEAISREPAWHCRVFRALRRGGADKRRGDDVPGGAPLPALRGEVRVRARLLAALRRRRRLARRLLGAADRRDRDQVPVGRVPRGHGCRLLLGRLPSRLDQVRPAARALRARGGRRLVALAGHW